uniref:Signal-induced proliferation-associated 1 like 2 n=1 Tax=Scleropages formosus TaxID=113540 RepID=A0A8C9VQB0_SCLFO
MSDPCPKTGDRVNPANVFRGFQDSSKNMQSDELFSKKLKALNGNMGPPKATIKVKSDSGGKTNGTPPMPKMGVRARVSEWPPKREGWEGRPPPNYESVVKGFNNGQSEQSGDTHEQGEEVPVDSYEIPNTKYSLSDFLNRSPLKGLHPIRQRSNSDVTISDIDAEDILDQNAVNPNTGASLHREYGSTSSIDRQGLSSEGFFTMLRGYRVDTLDHRSVYDTTISPSLQTAAQIARGEIVRISGFDYVDSSLLYSREREKSFIRRFKSETSETSLFRKLRTIKSEHDGLRLSTEQEDRRSASFQKCFAHYDVQSILFNICEAVANRANLGKRKNTTTGASAASQHQTPGSTPILESPLGSQEDLNLKENLDTDEGDGKSNDLVLTCPYFRNEIGGEGERRISLSRANSTNYSTGESCSFESSLSSHCTNAGVSVLEVPRESQPIHREKVKRYIIEHIDLGAYYYHKYFYGKEHQNYFGVDENLGPVAVSIRREKLDEGKDKEGLQYNYRVIFRTSELTTLRGAILEDAVPSTARHGTARGLPLKEVLEYVVPELNIQCLRLALNSPKVPEQLLKLDEQGLSFQHKVGILYCKAGQSTEEEMYNNEGGGPAFDEFLDLVGQRVRLKGFTKYRAQLDNKTDSTGTHSMYTTYKDYELMFHVSTLLPYTPNNRQQLLRKRHIGNDIVTIVFQEPGALPFTPKSVRSHFQHVFVIVKVHNPCTENVCYSVAVSRSKDVPSFGPPIPKGVTFPKSAVFRDFLLAKVINGENAAHKSEKFRVMATRTRQEYLKDLAENFVSTTTVDSAVKFSFITLGAKRKERTKPRQDAHLYSAGAVTWAVVARDFGQSSDIECLLGISNEFIVLVEEESKNVVFNCSCRDVIGWTSGPMSIKVFYERGECVIFSAQENCGDDIREIVQRMEVVTRGCETVETTLRRNSLGQLGFHVNFEGVVADVEPFGFAWQAGLRQGSRLVEICTVAVATLTHEQMIDLLRTSITVKVVIIPPYEDGTPRRGCSELYRIPMVEYKLDSEGTPCEYKTPFRRNTTWHRVPAPGGQALSRGSPTQGPDRPAGQPLLPQAQVIPRSTSFDRKLPDGSRYQHPNLSFPVCLLMKMVCVCEVYSRSFCYMEPLKPHCDHTSRTWIHTFLWAPTSNLRLHLHNLLTVLILEPLADVLSVLAVPPPQVSAVGSPSPRRSLYRTVSDESVCSNRKRSSFSSSRSSMLDPALNSDILFSTTPPYHSTLPLRASLGPGDSNLRNEFWFSDGSLADKAKLVEPGLIPLPDTASGLDWSHLVDAARAFEGKPPTHTQTHASPVCLNLAVAFPTPPSAPSSVNQLEVILRQLQHDLRKEKEDKALLQVEVQHLRQDNMRLQEESQTAAAQLRKFTEWFFNTIDKKQ